MPTLYRCEKCPPPPPMPPKKIAPPPPPPKPKPPQKKPSPPKKKKLNFKTCKKNTINSLNEVEHFLCNFIAFSPLLYLCKV